MQGGTELGNLRVRNSVKTAKTGKSYETVFPLEPRCSQLDSVLDVCFEGTRLSNNLIDNAHTKCRGYDAVVPRIEISNYCWPHPAFNSIHINKT
jgi:hypothetical protein